jgi:alkanesulfonate monooxygenase SsuD/methylene tetrahydromethanopterin reductase-like flavin-dependent oxidoreductase (luciferase family)
LRIGIGLPSPVLDVPGRLVVAWARRAEERGFSSLATIDRIAYPSYDSLTVLTAAAAVTDRIGLLTNILLGPVYSPVLLAKVTASLDQLSSGRLALGLGVGARPDDYQVAGRPFDDRGRRFDADLELLHAAWAGQPVAGSPFPVGPPATRGRIPLLIGGRPELAAPRAARWDAGFTLGGAPPEMAGGAIENFRKAWEEAGGTGRPRIVALSYFSLGEEHTAESLHNLRTYYGFLGDWAEGSRPAPPHRGGRTGTGRGLRGARRRRAHLRPHRGQPGPGGPSGRRGRGTRLISQAPLTSRVPGCRTRGRDFRP